MPRALEVDLPGRFRMAVREHEPAAGTAPLPGAAVPGAAVPGAAVPVVLVHGLASNALLWDGVAQRLAAAGHPCYAVDQRGHGLSADPGTGYDTDTCADDLAALITVLDLAAPVVVGQSWGGNVVLSLAARHPGVARAVACVDGGWLRLSDRFATFEQCWAALAPPVFDDLAWDDVERMIRAGHAGWPAGAAEATLGNLRRTPDGGVRARLTRDHHRSIVRSLFEGDPHAWYPRVAVPVLLAPARAEGDPAVADALASLPDPRVSYYPGAHHDLHAQHPDRLAADLLRLISAVT